MNWWTHMLYSWLVWKNFSGIFLSVVLSIYGLTAEYLVPNKGMVYNFFSLHTIIFGKFFDLKSYLTYQSSYLVTFSDCLVNVLCCAFKDFNLFEASNSCVLVIRQISCNIVKSAKNSQGFSDFSIVQLVCMFLNHTNQIAKFHFFLLL